MRCKSPPTGHDHLVILPLSRSSLNCWTVAAPDLPYHGYRGFRSKMSWEMAGSRVPVIATTIISCRGHNVHGRGSPSARDGLLP
eukprot:scaffold8271_cov171-Amphora_coffeaeformis.AAC.9